MEDFWSLFQRGDTLGPSVSYGIHNVAFCVYGILCQKCVIVTECRTAQRMQGISRNVYVHVQLVPVIRGGPSTFGALGELHSWRPPPQIKNIFFPHENGIATFKRYFAL